MLGSASATPLSYLCNLQEPAEHREIKAASAFQDNVEVQ